MLLNDVDGLFAKAMSKSILIDLFEVPVAEETMQGIARFTDAIAKPKYTLFGFNYLVFSGSFLRHLCLFAAKNKQSCYTCKPGSTFQCRSECLSFSRPKAQSPYFSKRR